MAGVGFSLGCVTVLCMRHPDISVLFTFFRVETLLKFEVRHPFNLHPEKLFEGYPVKAT